MLTKKAYLTGLLVSETRNDSNNFSRLSPLRSGLRNSEVKLAGVSRFPGPTIYRGK